MKKLTFLFALPFAISLLSATHFGQKRPQRRTTTISKPTVEDETKPTPKPVVAEVSPAQVLFNQGLKCDAKDYDCQISNYTKAINLDLKTKEVFKNRGNAYLQRKDFDKAIADFTKLIELDLNDASGYKNRGRIYLENSNFPQGVNTAIRDFTSAIDLEPKDVEAYKLRSSAYMKLRDYDKGKADMDKIAAIEPNNIDVVIIQGEMFLADKQYEKATESLTKAIEVKPTSKLYLGRANAYAAQKKYDLALSDFSKVIELDPKNAGAYNARGNAYLQLDKTDLAIQDINKAIELEPTTSYYFYKLGSIFAEKKNDREALSNFDKSIELDPKNAQALEARCIVYFKSAKYKEADDDCSKAINIKPDLEEGQRYKKYAYILITGDGDAEDYSKIIELNPNSYESYVMRALKSKNLQDIEKAIQINSKSPIAYYARACIYQNWSINTDDVAFRHDFYTLSKKIKETVEDFTTVIKLIDEGNNGMKGFADTDRIYAEAHYYLAANYYILTSRKDGKALDGLNKLVEKNPSNVWVYFWRGKFLETLWFNTPGISLDLKKTLSVWDKALDDYSKASVLTTDPEVKAIVLKKGSSLLVSRNSFVETMAKVDKDWKQQKREGLQAAIALIPTVVQTVVQSQSKTSSQTSPPVQQSPPPNTSSRPQTTQSGGTSNANSSQNIESDCPPYTGPSQATNTGAAEPGTQKEYGWSGWQNHPSYKGLLTRTRAMYQQKGQPYWYFEMEIKNNYQEEVSVLAFTSDKCKMRNNEINELYSDGSVVTIPAGGTGKETYLRSANSSQVKYWVTMYKKSGNGKIAKHDDGSLPLECQVYPNGQFCPGQP